MKNADLSKEQLVEQLGKLQDRIKSLEANTSASNSTDDALGIVGNNLSVIVENHADGIVIVDSEGTVLYANTAAEKLFGKSKSDFLGKPFGFPISTDKNTDTLTIKSGDLSIEVELQENEEKYRNLIENIEEIIYFTDTVGKIVHVSPQVSRYGYTPDDLLSLDSFIDLIFSADVERVIAEYKHAMTTGEVNPSEYRLLDHRGEVHWVETRSKIVRDASGKIIGNTGVLRDIAERKQMEEELQEMNARHSAMIENIGDVIAIVGANGITKYQSPNIEKWFGWKPEDLVGKNGWDKIHPEDIERIQKEYIKVLEKETPVTVEYRFKCKDGIYKWIELTAVNRISEPAIKGVLLNYHDITERKLTEEKLQNSENSYRRLFESAKDGILILDAASGQIVDVNPFITKMLGYSHHELLGKELWEIGVFKNIAASKDGFIELQTNEYIRFEGMPLETKGGKQINVEFISNVYLVNNKKVIQCNIRDITERKEAEDLLKSSELKFRTLADFTSDWEYWQDEKQQIIYMSPSCKKITGYNKEEFISYPTLLIKIIHPDDVSIVIEHEKGVHQNENRNKIEDTEFRIIKKDNSVVNLSHICRPIYDEEKNYIGRRISNRDITERIEAEHSLRQSEEKFKDLITNTEEIIYMVDKDGTFLLSEGKGLAKLGLEPGQVVGKSIFDLYKDYPDMLEEMERVFKGETVNMDVQIGENYFASRFTPQLNSEGEVIGLLGLSINITERRQAEIEIRKLSKVFIDGTVPTIIEDLDGIIQDINNEALNAYGYTREELIGKPINMLIPAERHSQADELLKNCREGKIVRNIEGLRQKKDGSVIPVLITLSLLKDDEDHSYAIASIATDITQRKKAETEIKNLNEDLEQRVKNRTAELETANKELEKFNNLFIGREYRIKELKEKVKELEAKKA